MFSKTHGCLGSENPQCVYIFCSGHALSSKTHFKFVFECCTCAVDYCHEIVRTGIVEYALGKVSIRYLKTSFMFRSYRFHQNEP